MASDARSKDEGAGRSTNDKGVSEAFSSPRRETAEEQLGTHTQEQVERAKELGQKEREHAGSGE